MNPAAILALLGDLYAQIIALREENDQLRAALAEQNSARNESAVK
jgi:hypothetical protein